MKNTLFRQGLIFGLLLTLINGCENPKNEFSQTNKVKGNITYQPYVRFIDGYSLESASDSKIVFPGLGIIDTVRAGDILIISPSLKVPYGMIREVINMASSENNSVISTKNATLVDAVIDGEIRFRKKLEEKNFFLADKAEGLMVKGDAKSFDGIALTLNNFKLPIPGGKHVTANGSTGISTDSVEMYIKIFNSKIERITCTVKLTKIDELSFYSPDPFNQTNEKVYLGKFRHDAIIVDGLVFNIDILMNAFVNGQTNAACDIGARQDRQLKLMMNYGVKWTNEFKPQILGNDCINPSLTSNADLEFGTESVFKLQLFDKEIITMNNQSYIELKADRLLNPWWKLYVGTEGSVQVKNEILGPIENYNAPLIITPVEIAVQGK